MSETPHVSVVIPTYNRAEYISAAIQSVLDQTYTDYEIIVIDDGSTDDTQNVVVRFSDQVRYIRQENAGSSAARNRGIQAARGELIAFLDSDDVFLPTKLQKQVAFMQAYPEVGLLHTQYVDVDAEGNILFTYPVDHVQGDIYRQLLPACPILTSTVMMPKKVFETVGEFDVALPMAQDIDMWIRVAKTYPVGAIPETLTHYLKHQSNKPRDLERILNYEIYILDKNFQPDHNLGRLFMHRTYAFVYLRTLNQWLAEGDAKNQLAWTYFKQGWRDLVFSRRGYTLAARLLFRRLFSVSLRQRIRTLWRRV